MYSLKTIDELYADKPLHTTQLDPDSNMGWVIVHVSTGAHLAWSYTTADASKKMRRFERLFGACRMDRARIVKVDCP